MRSPLFLVNLAKDPNTSLKPEVFSESQRPQPKKNLSEDIPNSGTLSSFENPIEPSSVRPRKDFFSSIPNNPFYSPLVQSVKSSYWDFALGTGLGTDVPEETLLLSSTGVTPGSYSFASITVDAQGRITAASPSVNPLDGDVVLTAKEQTLTNKTLTSPELGGAPYVNGSYRSNIVPVAALDIDCSLGNYFTKTIAADSTFTVSNVPASRAYSFTLELTHTAGNVTWFDGVEWPGGTPPTLNTGGTHLIVFITDDGGTRWRGAALANYAN